MFSTSFRTRIGKQFEHVLKKKYFVPATAASLKTEHIPTFPELQNTFLQKFGIRQCRHFPESNSFPKLHVHFNFREEKLMPSLGVTTLAPAVTAANTTDICDVKCSKVRNLISV